MGGGDVDDPELECVLRALDEGDVLAVGRPGGGCGAEFGGEAEDGLRVLRRRWAGG